MEQYQIDRIKKLMDAKGFNNRSLAHASGVNEMTIGRILNKPEYNPSIPMVDSISNALGVDTSYIIEKEKVSRLKKPINGFVEYGGIITSIKTFKQLETLYERIKQDLESPSKRKKVNSDKKTVSISVEKSIKPDLHVGDYDLYCCYNFDEATAFSDSRWCYCHAEGMYDRYTQGTGYLFIAAKRDYEKVQNPHKGNDVQLRFKEYDEFATSLFSLTTFINPMTGEADVFSVTFRRNDTSRHYEGQHKDTYDEMMSKANELLKGFDFGTYCIEKTKAKPRIIQGIKEDKKKQDKPKRESKKVKMSQIEGFGDIDNKLKKKIKRVGFNSLAELFQQRDSILEKEKERLAKCNENYAKAKPLSWDDFSFRKTHTYDTSKMDCWSFNSNTDVRNGISLDVGNMSNGFGVRILGIDFKNSEVPYQLPIFKNDEASVAVQKEVADPSNPYFSNGLGMKRNYIYNKKYASNRRDEDFELGNQNWCFEWMKFVVWEKVKQNKGFREILLSIPQNAMIVEQAQKKGHVMWGCWNEELQKEREIIRLAYAIESGKSIKSPKAKNEIYHINCVSKWVGENAMGQILTMAKLALNQGIQMPIDTQMLNDAKINWFGKVLEFTNKDDGSVVVEAK